MTARFLVGDVRDRLADIDTDSVDLVLTSPPFLALRSYLPDDHPDKHREIGSEPDPASFVDTMLGLVAEWDRVLAPHGTLCVELGDTYAGGGQGPDPGKNPGKASTVTVGKSRGDGWPLAKSMAGVPALFAWSLAYGRNLLTGRESPAGQWRIRNQIVWARPNPAPGAPGDKFRPATSYVTVATRAKDRWFDLDAVRTTPTQDPATYSGNGYTKGNPSGEGESNAMPGNPAGAPPLDWHADPPFDEGDWLWQLPTAPYKGKTTTVRREPCGPDDGGERIASPDCPRHGGLPGQVPKALRDEREAATPSRSSRTRRNGDRPELEPLPGFASTDATPDRSGSVPDPTSDSPAPSSSPAATTRSTTSNRTVPAPATSPAGTPSARTTDHTAGTSTSPESSAPDPDTHASSTSSDGSDASPSPRTPDDTPDTQPADSIPCTCSYFKKITESSSHYAVFPAALPRKLIAAMCPERVCTVCGQPSRRITSDPEYVQSSHGGSPATLDMREGTRDPMIRNWSTTGEARGDNSVTAVRETIGWTDCGHDAWRTGMILDPFAGSGTTLQAATEQGRHSVGIDLNPANADLAQQRCGMFLDID